MVSWPLVQYVLTAAFRDRLIAALVIAILVGASLSLFIGSAAVTEKDQFALVFAGGALRVAGVLGLALFASFHIRRSFEAREVEFLLSRPIGRAQFLFSHALAFAALGFFLALAQGLALYIVAPKLFGSGSVLWIASVVAENIIMVSVALFFSMILSSAAAAVMASAALYILSRMMGEILGIIDSGGKLYDLSVLEWIMQGISAVMPRLDLFGQTSWLVYGPGTEIGYGFIALQGLVFTALILMATFFDLSRRQF
jgi:ABC-type transport system involved in multi-copper enzyme maturation permease subunit